MKKLLAEFLGTFCLVFAGTGAIVIDETTNGAVTHVGISLTFGLIVMAMIYALGEISGAHLNPAVTLGFTFARRFRVKDLPGYMIAQMLGAMAASVVLHILFPSNESLGMTQPTGSAWQSLVLETILTFMLMLVILSVATGSKERGVMAGVAIGGVVALEALFAGPISGASMNPARSLGPAIVSGHIASIWIYLVAPFAGAAAATGCWIAIKKPVASDPT